MRIYYINDKQETEGYFYEMLKIKIRQWVEFNIDKIIDRKYGVLHIEHKEFEVMLDLYKEIKVYCDKHNLNIEEALNFLRGNKYRLEKESVK